MPFGQRAEDEKHSPHPPLAGRTAVIFNQEPRIQSLMLCSSFLAPRALALSCL